MDALESARRDVDERMRALETEVRQLCGPDQQLAGIEQRLRAEFGAQAHWTSLKLAEDLRARLGTVQAGIMHLRSNLREDK